VAPETQPVDGVRFARCVGEMLTAN
jgi:hypothetical protein